MAQAFLPGTETWIASDSATSSFSAIFEDNSETGYFYAYDRAASEDAILDAVHIYNVANVTDRHMESTVAIVWSTDGLKAMLLLNDYPHAVIDFAARTSYCRTGFPPSPDSWQRGVWDEGLVRWFRENDLPT